MGLAALTVRSTQHYVGRLEAEAKLRRETEETLRQSQKLEAVGQLTGGIAHDFNNLLTIIIGNLDTMQRRIGQAAGELAAKLKEPLDHALQGARSAAQLTHRLLAFSRRQALEPKRLDLNAVVSGMSELLRRTLGETINVETVLAGGLVAGVRGRQPARERRHQSRRQRARRHARRRPPHDRDIQRLSRRGVRLHSSAMSLRVNTCC